MQRRFENWLVKILFLAFLTSPQAHLTAKVWEEFEGFPLALHDEESEQLVSLRGILLLEILPRDPENPSSTEEPIFCWMVKLDPESFELACQTRVRAAFHSTESIRESPSFDKLELVDDSLTKEWLFEHLDKQVTVHGYLFHGHTGHHHAALLLDSKPWNSQ